MDSIHSHTQSPSYAQCDEGLWPNPYSKLASDWLVLTPDIVFLPRFYGIRLWIWPEPLVAPRARRALGTRMLYTVSILLPKYSELLSLSVNVNESPLKPFSCSSAFFADSLPPEFVRHSFVS